MKNLDDKLRAFHSATVAPQILDIGGWFAPCKQATHMVDIMPLETMNVAGAYGYGELQIRKENFFQLDLGEIERLPFEDQKFDFVVCRHTLEDIKDPIKICREMMRVAKAGYIETPSRTYESTKGVERHWWCGHYHHRWFVEASQEAHRVTFQFKPHNVHSSRRFSFRCFPWQKVREEFKNTALLWEGRFEAREKVVIDYRDVQADLIRHKKSMQGKRLFRLRWLED